MEVRENPLRSNSGESKEDPPIEVVSAYPDDDGPAFVCGACCCCYLTITMILSCLR